MDSKNSILIIEDKGTDLLYLDRILHEEYAIVTAKDAAEAQQMARDHSPDLILLDIVLPDNDGFEALAALIASEQTKDIPIIYITGHGSGEDESKALDMGATDYITKPFSDTAVRLRVSNQMKIVNQMRDLDRRLQQQTLLNSIIQNFLKDESVDDKFNQALQSLGEFMGISQVMLYMLDEDYDVLVCQYEWVSQALLEQTDHIAQVGSTLSLDVSLRSIVSSLIFSGEYCLSSNDSYHKEIMMPYMFEKENFIAVPIFIKGEFCAILDFFRDSHESVPWCESEINLACIMGTVLSGVFELNAVEDNLNTIMKLQAEIAVSKYLAEQSSRAKSEFLSRMSHEMRTPMNAIIGMTNISLITDDLLKKNECLHKVGSASRNLLRLIDDVLDMSDIEERKLSFVPSEFSFTGMLNSVFDEVSSLYDDKHHTFTTIIDPSIPEMLVSDEKRLAQVVYNLLSNAGKFTNDYGEISFCVFVLKVENDLLTLQVEVRDNGIGISEEQQKKLFVAFEQVDGSINRKYGGAGLGLVISKNIVEMMGGELWVESELGKGSTFFFTFKARIKANEMMEDGTIQSFHGMTALLVEDVEINREIVMAMLEDTRMKIVCATNGLEAVELFTSGKYNFDVIFMDINMPEMDGVEATRIIREVWPQGVKIPIIAMTANVHPDEVASYLAAGMSGHIGKPIDFDKLLRMIRLYMN